MARDSSKVVDLVRSSNPQRSRFEISLEQARDRLSIEIHRLVGKSLLLPTNLPERLRKLQHGT